MPATDKNEFIIFIGIVSQTHMAHVKINNLLLNFTKCWSVLKSISSADSAANFFRSKVITEEPTASQIHNKSAYLFIVNCNTCFRHCPQFFTVNISQGSAAMLLKCDGIFTIVYCKLTAGSMHQKSVNICLSYEQEHNNSLFPTHDVRNGEIKTAVTNQYHSMTYREILMLSISTVHIIRVHNK